MTENNPSNISYSAPELELDQTGNFAETGLEDFKKEVKIGDDEDNYLVDMYLKVGLFCNWSWSEFMTVPRHIVLLINQKIDERLENLDDDSSIFSYGYLETLLAIGKAFSGGK